MIGFYNYTVILTYLGLASSAVGIFTLCNNPQALPLAICLLLFSGMCDMFDGRVARTRKRSTIEENFGAQIDSLSDMVCFGIYPAVIAFFLMGCVNWIIPFLVLFILCGLVRLAYFDVRAIEKKYNPTAEIGNEFIGLPITCSSLLLPLLYAVKPLYCLFISNTNMLGYHIFITVCITLCAAAFVSPFRIKKPGKLGVICLLTFGVLIFIACIIGNIAYNSSL